MRTLRGDDPAELLALASLQLGQPPRESVVLLGRRGPRMSVGARIDLPAPSSVDPAAIDGLVTALRRAGCTGALGIVVLGDGREGAGRPLGEGLVVAARTLWAASRGDGFELDRLWVIADGKAVAVGLEPGSGADEDLALVLTDPRPLGAPESTLVAAQAAFAGQRVPRPCEEEAAALAGVRALIASAPGGRGPRTLPRPPVSTTWRRALEALDALAVPGAANDPAAMMSVCERVIELVRDMARTERRDTLLMDALWRGQARDDGGADAFINLLTNPAIRPHASIRAGGRWYEGLRRVESLTRPADVDRCRPHDPEVRAGWSNVASCLALLAWWDRRFATAGVLTRAVLRHDPDHSMARLASHLVTGPVVPGGGASRARRDER